MSPSLKMNATAHNAASDVLTPAYQARDTMRDHLTASLALCDDVLARCEQMKNVTREK